MDKKEALSLLNTLMTAGTPPPSKFYYMHCTAGEEYRNLAKNFTESIRDLSEIINGYLPRVILGSIGIGKTHFLRYLYLLLEKELGDSKDTLCSWIELRELNEETDFQYLFIKGLSSLHEEFPIGTQYQKVLQTIYNRIADPIINGQNYSVDQKRIITRQILDTLLDTAATVSPMPTLTIPGKLLAKIVLQITRKKQDKKRLEMLRRNAVFEEVTQLGQIAYQKEFIYQLINLGEGRHQNSDFDRVLQELAKQSKHNELIDLTMKLLHKAGYTRLIIFIDEMEHINSRRSSGEIEKYSERSAQILNLFHRLHQNMVDHAGQEKSDSYPSVAQIMVMPDYILDSVITKIDPATAERLNINRFALNLLPKNSPTTNELIRKIWDLHELAGYKFKTNSDIALKKIKDSVYDELKSKTTPATMRHLIPNLIKIIQAEWLKA